MYATKLICHRQVSAGFEYFLGLNGPERRALNLHHRAHVVELVAHYVQMPAVVGSSPAFAKRSSLSAGFEHFLGLSGPEHPIRRVLDASWRTLVKIGLAKIWCNKLFLNSKLTAK